MSIKKIMKSVPSEPLAANGLLYQDYDAITPCQRECSRRFSITIQLEQEAYLSQHPELITMMELFICKMSLQNKRKCNFLKEAADYFLQDPSTLDEDIRQQLKIGPTGPYTQGRSEPFHYDDKSLERDLKLITAKYFPPESWQPLSSRGSPPNTESSSFLSIQTSATTIPTPEPVPTPPPTFSETVFAWVSNTIDKAIFLKVDNDAVLYDTAYVELAKVVEAAMEIPVIEIREDIAELCFLAYQNFEAIILEKERIAAEIAWEKRMRKKMKKSLRRQENFKGYETPPTPKSVISSHESYKKPPPRPCKCHPPFHYNRYAKDRFGIYLPQDEGFSNNNVTVTPAISLEDLVDEVVAADDTTDDKSARDRKGSMASTKTTGTIRSNKSRKSVKSAISGKTAVTIKSPTSVRSITSEKSNPISVMTDATDITDVSK